MRDRTRAAQRNDVSFQRVAVIGVEARRSRQGAHDPIRTYASLTRWGVDRRSMSHDAA